ncbi:peptidoglycan-binding protein [Streptomyces sp. NPDC057249]|uniref:peptidoglycan-binding domain-containing protein n=1 Tax=Streptomyces sp. NPDC057249 TaxID=3346067 RepID=UPI0036445FAA
MARTRTTRTKAALTTGAMVLAAMGGSLLTATPAAAIGWCNATVTVRGSFIEWAGEAKIPSYGTNKTCQMSKGSHSSAVGALQLTLNKCYGEKLSVDNDFGENTRLALIRAQKRAGTGADGIYGPNTRDALGWYFKPVTPGYDECSRI